MSLSMTGAVRPFDWGLKPRCLGIFSFNLVLSGQVIQSCFILAKETLFHAKHVIGWLADAVRPLDWGLKPRFIGIFSFNCIYFVFKAKLIWHLAIQSYILCVLGQDFLASRHSIPYTSVLKPGFPDIASFNSYTLCFKPGFPGIASFNLIYSSFKARIPWHRVIQLIYFSSLS